MSPSVSKLLMCSGVFAVLVVIVVRGLVTQRLRTRVGLVLTPKERPFSFYASVVLYCLVACAFLYKAVRTALYLLGK